MATLADLKQQPMAPRVIAFGVVATVQFAVVALAAKFVGGGDNKMALRTGAAIGGLTLALGAVGEIAIAAS